MRSIIYKGSRKVVVFNLANNIMVEPSKGNRVDPFNCLVIDDYSIEDIVFVLIV